jgi:hypothetical protein
VCDIIWDEQESETDAKDRLSPEPEFAIDFS